MLDDVMFDRRTLLRWCAVGAGAAALASCSAGGGSNGEGTPTSPSTRVPSTSGAPAGVPWNQLKSSLSGRLVLPGAPSYLTDLRLYDPRFDGTRPAAIAFCSSPTDVQRCIAFARENNVPFTARSGGHSYAGYSSNRGLVIDVTSMNAVTVNGGRATIGSGARLIDVYSSLNGRGLSIPGGSCPTVGIAGLALGGGVGVVGRRHGLTCDAVTSVQIVTADGRVVTGAVGLFTLRFPWSASVDVLPAWMTWIDGAPDPLWSNCILSTPSENGAPSISINGIWSDAQAGVGPLVAQLVASAGANPTTNFLETIPLAHAMYVEAGCGPLSEAACHLPSENSQGRLTRSPSLAASSYLDAVPPDAGIQAIVGGITDRSQQNGAGAIAFDSYGGAINRVPSDATAFVHRSTLCCAQYSVSYDPGDSPARVAEHQAWLARYGAALRPYVSGAAYQNYIDPMRSDFLTAYYGDNLPRLQAVKKQWDPDDAFRFAQSIPVG